ncbi:MAG: TonB-dependent receptor, partial [Bacteroidetes bacterium]|nr:TonB-dependent receptor [Bacteroidota bacterium]
VVTDNVDGSPLPGVSVILKGSTTGTITDVDGAFSLNANTTDVLVFSYVGYTSQEFPVGAQTNFAVGLAVDIQQLEEIVVTGYTSQSKRTVTGAMSQINVDEAFAVPTSNAAEALQGRVSGVSVINSGQPGADPIVRIRGFGTTNNNGPLYVIDGMQTTDGGLLSQINPDDIQSINVLKDASAAIYGARASNGVIIVTTKGGSYGGKPTITFNTYFGSESVGSTPDVLNSQQLGDVFFESQRNDGATPSHPQFGSGANPAIPAFIRGDPSLPYDPAPGNAGNRVTRSSAGTNWADEVFQKSFIQNYNLSVAGGSDKSKFFTSLGYQNREGVIPNGGFERFTTRLNTDFRVNDHVRVGEHVSVGYVDRQRLQSFELVRNTQLMSPLVPPLDEAGNLTGSGPSTSAGLSNTRSPLAQATRTSEDFDQILRVFADAFVEVSFAQDFAAKSTIGISYEDLFGHDFTFLDPEHSEPISTNTLREDNFLKTSWVWTNQLSWDKNFGDHDINALVGVEAVDETERENTTDVTGFLFEDPNFLILGAGTGTPNINTSTFSRNTLFSIFGRVGYAYQGKYLATISIRRDKTSRFIDNTGTFLAGSLGWIISDEDFMQGQTIFSNLKLRTSYGEVGNQTLPAANPDSDIFQLSQEFGFYPLNGSSPSTGAILSSIGNEDLRWETSKQFNIGLDMGFLNNDLSVTFDYFDINTQDMIVASPLPSTSIDASAPFVNAGEVSNSGVDLSIGYGNHSSSSVFRYDASFIFSAVSNELVKINDATPDAFILGQNTFRQGAMTRSSAGEPISYFFGRVVEGIFQNAAEVSAAADQGFVTPADGVGRFRYKDLNGDGIINDDDREKLGSPHANFTWGLNLNLGYQNFDVVAYFQGSQGNDIYNYARIFTDYPTFFNNNRSVRVLDSWRDTNPGAELPALSQSITNNETAPNSSFIEDGSYWRLKNLQIGYTFPESLLSNIGLTRARVYLQGTNLFTVTDYSGIDPEFGSTSDGSPGEGAKDLTLGVNEGQFYPVSKILTMGLGLTF